MLDWLFIILNFSLYKTLIYLAKLFIIKIYTINNFVKKTNANLTIMGGGEHRFHTKEQMEFLDKWFKSNI